MTQQPNKPLTTDPDIKGILTTDNNTNRPADLTRVSSFSGRELKSRAFLTKQDRFEVLRRFLGNVTLEQLASMLQCSARTVGRYKKEFFESEEYSLYRKEQLFLLLNDQEISKTEKLRAYIQLEKLSLMRIEVNKNIQGSVTVRIVDDAPMPKP